MSYRRPDHIGLLFIDLRRDFIRRLSERLADQGIELRELHGMILHNLTQQGPSKLVDLASACAVTPQSMMTAVNELERRGYLRRIADPQDQRAKRIELTGRGIEAEQVLTATTIAIWAHYAEQVGQETLRQTQATLARLLNNSDTPD